MHWVLGPVNLGFAAAVNALVEHTPPDADLLVLNPDARLQGPLTRTRELLRQPGVAAVSPMLRGDGAPGPARWDIATRRATLIRLLVSAAGYSDSLRGTRFSHLYARQPTESQSIDGYVAGACLAISRAAWNAVGGFDEEFYLYGEEADWQARARAAGWRILLADELGVDHGNRCTGEGANGLGSDARRESIRPTSVSAIRTCCAPIPRYSSNTKKPFTTRIYTLPAQRFWTGCSGRSALRAERRAPDSELTCRRS